MTRVLNKLKLIKGDGAGLFMIDSELAQRLYVPAATDRNDCVVYPRGNP